MFSPLLSLRPLVALLLAVCCEKRKHSAQERLNTLNNYSFPDDQGVISGVQEMETFKARFPMNPRQNGFVVAILELGAWTGAWLSAYPADRFSRKYTIVIACVVFLLGSSFQGGAQDINYLMAGRFICGMAVGSLSMIV